MVCCNGQNKIIGGLLAFIISKTKQNDFELSEIFTLQKSSNWSSSARPIKKMLKLNSEEQQGYSEEVFHLFEMSTYSHWDGDIVQKFLLMWNRQYLVKISNTFSGGNERPIIQSP